MVDVGGLDFQATNSSQVSGSILSSDALQEGLEEDPNGVGQSGGAWAVIEWNGLHTSLRADGQLDGPMVGQASPTTNPMANGGREQKHREPWGGQRPESPLSKMSSFKFIQPYSISDI